MREHGLLALARAGRGVLPPGRPAGSRRSSNATQNFYGLHGLVSPMVFVGTEFWRTTMPAWDVLVSLFDDHDMLHLTDVDEVVDFLSSHPPIPWHG